MKLAGPALVAAVALAIVLGVVLALVWPSPEEPPERAAALGAPSGLRAGEPIRPLPGPPALDPREVELGRRLFHDPRLSGDGSLSCASCHDLARGGADGRVRSVGLGGREAAVNAPTVFNSGLNFRQFWDGRAETLAHQIEDARAGELGATWVEILARLEDDPGYRRSFADLYPQGLAPASVTGALAAFLRSLATPDGRFDRYLLGDDAALTAEEKEGYRLFKTYGCAACHQGAGVGGNMFQRFGALGDYFADRGAITEADYGRFNVTGAPEDRHVFKVPMLRNVALTAPYFHDGQAETLEEAVQAMARYQLGRELGAEETRLIVAFLHTLTGEYRGEPLDGARAGR